MIRRMFSGRLGRLEYWKATILLTGLTLIPAVLIAALAGFLSVFGLGETVLTSILVLLFLVVAVPLVILMIAGIGLSVRRLHDLGLPGFLAFVIIAAQLLTTAFGIDWSDEALTEAPWLFWFDIAFWMIFLALGFWPARTESNTYGDRTRYGSWWGALFGKRKIGV